MNDAVLAGGSDSRLFPQTMMTNKHELPAAQAPLIWHPLWKLKDDGVSSCLAHANELALQEPTPFPHANGRS